MVRRTLQVRYAVGYENLTGGDFALRTLYNFRRRLSQYNLAHGINLVAGAFVDYRSTAHDSGRAHRSAADGLDANHLEHRADPSSPFSNRLTRRRLVSACALSNLV
jgi:hypothetical protein